MLKADSPQVAFENFPSFVKDRQINEDVSIKPSRSKQRLQHCSNVEFTTFSTSLCEGDARPGSPPYKTEIKIMINNI